MALRTPPPLRQNNQPDVHDGARVEYARGLWRSQDGAWRPRDREIEDNVRMLCGQQWNVWSPLLQRYFDISEWMTDAERRWRQRPVINHLLSWFILTHARLTENPPIVTFVPGPDRLDAQLAEVLDTLSKVHWRSANMGAVIDRAMAWLIAAGESYIYSTITTEKGPWQPWIGQAQVPILQPDGTPLPLEDGSPALLQADTVPFDKDGNPLAQAIVNPETGLPELVPQGQPYAQRMGDIQAYALSPLEVRGEWGPKEWHDKQWHAARMFYTPEEVYANWGVECEPDTTVDDANSSLLDRLLFGAGWFGAASNTATSGSVFGGAQPQAKLDLCEVLLLWERPRSGVAGMEEQPGQPGGRFLVVTATKVLRDGPRPVAYPYCSPLRRFGFVNVPGRPSYTTPLEAMKGSQRSYNKLRAQVTEHANLCSNPKYLLDKGAGIEDGQWTNEPGTGLAVNRRPGVPAVEWIAPPRLGDDVYKALELAKNEILDLGNLRGTQGEPLDPDQSGEAIKELRFNSDRFLGPTARRSVEEFGRMIEDWIALMPLIYTQERAVQYAGDDNISTTIIVYPELFIEGKVNVVPDVESMLPEGRGERQQRIFAMYNNGMFGMPGTPEALRTYFDLARFPHLSRSAKPGGVDRTMAEQENGKLQLGTPVTMIPVFQWQDHMVHLMVHETVMKSPEYQKFPPQVQMAFEFHRLQHIFALQGAPLSPTPGAMLPAPSGGVDPAGSSSMAPMEQPSLLPSPPTPPTAGVPGGAMPTAPNEELSE